MKHAPDHTQTPLNHSGRSRCESRSACAQGYCWQHLCCDQCCLEGRSRLASLTAHKTCQASFSSLSTLLIARVGGFFSIFRDLQECHTFAPLQCKILRYFTFFLFSRILHKFADFSANRAFFAANLTEFAGIAGNCGELPEHGEFCRRILKI